jgi:hypothetical protein
MVKLSYIIVVILVILIAIVLSLLSSKEHYTSRAPLPDLPPLSESELQSYQKKHKYGFNGNPFFEKQVMPQVNSKQVAYAYNGYKIPTKNNEYIPENVDQITLNEIKSTTKSKGLLDTFFDQFINKQIGTMSVINNEKFNIKGNYGNNSNLSNFKIISGQNNLPGVIDLSNNINLSSNSNLSILKQTPTQTLNPIQGNTIQGENDNASLPDTGYVKFLINTFVKYISTSSKYNFIFDNNQDFVNLEIITNVDGSKEFTIPFFLYESTLNYTRGITVNFHLIPGGKLIYGLPIYDIHILNIVQSEINGGKLKLEPVKFNTFEQPIMDTNGYYQIFNSLGLMYPFETSSNTITSDYYNLKGTSEGAKIPTTVFQEQISKFNAI